MTAQSRHGQRSEIISEYSSSFLSPLFLATRSGGRRQDWVLLQTKRGWEKTREKETRHGPGGYDKGQIAASEREKAKKRK